MTGKVANFMSSIIHQGHFTTAVDTTLIKVVMISVQDSILLRNLAFTTF